MVGHNMSIGSKETCTYAPVLQPSIPTPKYMPIVTSTRRFSKQTLEPSHCPESNINDSARDRRGLVRSYFYKAPGRLFASMESGSTDVVQIHSIIVQRPKRWSGASDADPRESHGKLRASNCDSQRDRSDNDWPGKAPLLHSHVSTPQLQLAILG